MKSLLAVAIVAIAVYAAFIYLKEESGPKAENSQEIYNTYRDSELGIGFKYPRIWGEIKANPGNTKCPEEDTYRTQETLNVYDREYEFSNIRLENTESFIRSGIRIYELDTSDINNCQDRFLLSLAKKEIIPEALSSVMLQSVQKDGAFAGVYNPRASRLNTEAREQYTMFLKGEEDKVLIAQVYMSFTPVSGSPELKELEEEYGGNMDRYVKYGTTARQVRNHFTNFRSVAKSIVFE